MLTVDAHATSHGQGRRFRTAISGVPIPPFGTGDGVHLHESGAIDSQLGEVSPFGISVNREIPD